MKFLRYGEAGQEKPGILDADGAIRDLSAHVSDLSGAALAPMRWPSLALSTSIRCQRSKAIRALARALLAPASSSASVSTIPTMRLKRALPYRQSRSSS